MKFLALFDAHIGWSMLPRDSGGAPIRRPTHNGKAIKTALNFAKWLDPDVVILGGDQSDWGSISHWNSKKPLQQAASDITRDKEATINLLLDPLDKIARRKIWMQGNHERFLFDFVEQVPALKGEVNLEALFHLKERGWEVRNFGEIFTLGKLNFVHGDKISRSSALKNICAKALESYGQRNLRFGHYHTWGAATRTNLFDWRDFHSAVAIPCLASVNPIYLFNQPSQIVNGFAWGEVSKRGNFDDHVVILIDNKFTLLGRTFGPEEETK